MMIASETIHRGRLDGTKVGASIHVAACEAVGVQPDHPGVQMRIFTFVGEAPIEGMPDIEFELVVRKPDWW